MFVFCMKELGFSIGCIQPDRSRACRSEVAAVIAALRSGRVHLAGLRVLVPHLTEINCELLLNEAAGKSKKGIEELAARIAPVDAVAS